MPHKIGEVAEAALVVLVPQVEPLIGKYRERHDSSAALGVPAHITVNYPFVPGVTRTEATLEELAMLFAEWEPFDFSLVHLARFPDVLYLAPEPEAPFTNLIAAVAARYPESPPYGGAHSEVIPHLTIAKTADERVLKSLETRLASLLEGHLPVAARAEEVWLLENQGERWENVVAFRLGKRE